MIAAAGIGFAQTWMPGPQVTTYFSAVDDTDQPYALYLPKNFSASSKYPLVISLHGADSNHRLNLRRVFGKGNLAAENDAEATRYFPRLRDVDYIVASPLVRGTMGYQGIAEKDVYDVLADVKRRFPIDTDRIYLTGLSMGGGGTLWLGLTRPDIWAAIAPVCPAAPDGLEELAGNALNVPVKMFQGAIDPTVNPEGTRRWDELFTKSGVKSEYVEYPGVRHNSWDSAYKDGAIFDWFDRHKLVTNPNRVKFAARDYAHGSAYWVRFDGRTGDVARIDARFTGKNALTIDTENLDGFTLRLKTHPMVSPAKIFSISVDGAVLKTKFQGSMSLSKGAKGWVVRAVQHKPSDKRAGLEGPIADALGSRHIYVYGTADASPPEEIERRRNVALAAATWGAPKRPLLLTMRVMADDEIKDKDLAGANLILFGTRETNTWIAKYAASLPMELNAGAADYGLVYVYPVNGRYVVINSGLPWWTRADQMKSPAWNFTPKQYRIAQGFGDYILFRGGLDHVVAEGTFDAHWKLPSEAAAKLADSGVVKLQ
jgi:enterochelin esterase-like enzyme